MPLIRNRAVGIAFLVGTILTTAGVCVLFYTQTVPVKMLPFDNEPEFSIVVSMPEGTTLPVTANVVYRLAEKVCTMLEVTAREEGRWPGARRKRRRITLKTQASADQNR